MTTSFVCRIVVVVECDFVLWILVFSVRTQSVQHGLVECLGFFVLDFFGCCIVRNQTIPSLSSFWLQFKTPAVSRLKDAGEVL